MKAGDVMTRDPIYASALSPIRAVMRQMHEEDIRHCPIVEDGEVVGMVSDRDLRNVVAPFAVDLETPDQWRRRMEEPVSTIMSIEAISVVRTDPVTEVIDLMIRHKIGAVPVIDGDSRNLVGIISTLDLLGKFKEYL